MTRQSSRSIMAFPLLLVLLSCSVGTQPVDAFFRSTPSPKTALTTKRPTLTTPRTSEFPQIQQSRFQRSRYSGNGGPATKSSTTELNMFMGSDGGILGVGTPEVFTILLVGYFVLGPSDLYKLVKEIGKFVQNIRTLGSDLSTTLESNLESQLQLEEIRKAQRELNDAFSFRRTINVDEQEEAFSTTVTTPRPGEAAADASATTAAAAAAGASSGTADGTKKKKIRRRKKVAPPPAPVSDGSVPDLEMPVVASTPSPPETTKAAVTTKETESKTPELEGSKGFTGDPFVKEEETKFTKEEEDQINADFDRYTSGPLWFDEEDVASAKAPAATVTIDKTKSAADTSAEKSRFQQQLSGNWNQQILKNEDKLSPLGKVMDLLALLEEEKIASTKRLEDEFRQRAELEEEIYRKQRRLLEDAAADIQSDAYKF